jgi:hypothetical protein
MVELRAGFSPYDQWRINLYYSLCTNGLQDELQTTTISKKSRVYYHHKRSKVKAFHPVKTKKSQT